jgi:hypothetical protein
MDMDAPDAPAADRPVVKLDIRCVRCRMPFDGHAIRSGRCIDGHPSPGFGLLIDKPSLTRRRYARAA